MLSHGDEYGRTQQGNNNVYCQDNELAWFRWDWSPEQQQLFEFTRELIKIRKSQPVTHKRRFFKGRRIRGAGVEDIRWLNTKGTDMTDEQWDTDFIRCMGMLLNGELINEVDEQGEIIKDDILLLIVNSYWEPIGFTLPDSNLGEKWEVLIDTSRDNFREKENYYCKLFNMPPRTLILLRNIR